MNSPIYYRMFNAMLCDERKKQLTMATNHKCSWAAFMFSQDIDRYKFTKWNYRTILQRFGWFTSFSFGRAPIMPKVICISNLTKKKNIQEEEHFTKNYINNHCLKRKKKLNWTKKKLAVRFEQWIVCRISIVIGDTEKEERKYVIFTRLLM